MLGADNEYTIDILYEFAKLLRSQSRLEEAEELSRLALDGYHNLEAGLGKDAKSWKALETLYNVLEDSKKFSKRPDFCEDLLCLRERYYPKYDVVTLDIAHDLGSIFVAQGERDKADAVHQCYDQASETVLEKTENQETDVSDTLAALNIESSGNSDPPAEE